MLLVVISILVTVMHQRYRGISDELQELIQDRLDLETQYDITTAKLQADRLKFDVCKDLWGRYHNLIHNKLLPAKNKAILRAMRRLRPEPTRFRSYIASLNTNDNMKDFFLAMFDRSRTSQQRDELPLEQLIRGRLSAENKYNATSAKLRADPAKFVACRDLWL